MPHIKHICRKNRGMVTFFLLLSFSFSIQAKKVSILQCFNLAKPNMDLGHIGPKNDRISQAIALKEKELEGLSYSGLVAWAPKSRLAVKRFLIEKMNMNFLSYPLPAYDKTQKLGRATMSAKDIRWSQSMCANVSQDKKYSVVKNAKAFKDGSLKVEMLPKIRVWRDVEGRVWTLDHRRLAAMRLSGVVDKIEVEFVSEALVLEQRFKFSSQNSGRSILVHLDEDDAIEDLAIVITNEGASLK